MSSTETPADRLHGLDALRGGALLLGVVLHASMAYIPAPIWIATDAQTSPWAAGLFFAIHLFRMTTFFLIAGLFAHMMLARKGWLAFARDRLSRIGGVLFGLWWLIFPAIVAVLIWKAAIDNGGSLPTDAPPPPAMTVQNFPLTHLWFLWVLLIFYAVLLAGRAAFRALDRSGEGARLVDRATGLLIGPWSPAVFAAPLALAFLGLPSWIPFFGIPTPDTGLIPNPVALTGFGLAFAAGVLIDRRRDLLQRLRRSWVLLTVVAVGTGVAALYLVGGPVPRLAPITDAAMVATTAWTYALAVFAATFAAVALALRFASGHSAVRRYLADASYWVYIVHLPLVMAGQVLLLNASWPWFAKLAAVVGGVMVVSLLTYELLVRHSFIGKWLSGRRVPWRRTPASVPVAAE